MISSTVTQLTNDTPGSAAVTTNTRYVAYSNDATGTEANKPAVKAYDNNVAAVLTTGTFGIHAAGTTHAGKPYFEVPQYRFYSYPGNSEIYAVSSSGQDHNADDRYVW